MNAHAPQPLGCPRCHKPVDVKSRHVSVAGSTVQVYCSDSCLRGVTVLETSVEIVKPARRWQRWWLAAGVALGGATVVVYAEHREDAMADVDQLAVIAPPPPIAARKPPEPAPSPPGPSAGDRARRAADEALLHELMQDTWIHPLAGPQRRMPANHTGAFGAVRDNAPPPECLQGHCGVDVGRDWGEPVHAVHEGIVDWVNRGPNEDNGGVFVKIAHRGGTLFSWYFHLAAVPRWVQPGTKVTVGTVIGLLGDTGVKRSAPHLHFAMTVKPSRTARERYIDPEPLLAVWPLWLPDEHRISTLVAAPGLPVRGPMEARPRPRAADAAPEPASSAAGPDPSAPPDAGGAPGDTASALAPPPAPRAPAAPPANP